jgi:phosphatidylserine/phosphatidylglycerophosphate/cardiolipin synthase-like enzyme
MVAEFNWRWEVLEGEVLREAAAPESHTQVYETPEGDTLADDADADDSPVYEFVEDEILEVEMPADEPESGSVPAGVEFLVQRPGTPQVGARFFDLVAAAEREIWVASPFVSYAPALRALEAAARRGVRVVFVFPSGRQEMEVSGRVLRSAAPGLVNSGVALYFNNLRMAHTKVMVVDGRYTLMGSFNLNHRSFRHDLETALLVDDPVLAGSVVERIFGPYLQISEPVPATLREPWNPLNWIVEPFT